MDFGAMIQTWINVLTHPGEAVFQEERAKPQATLANAIIWIIVAGIFAAIFAAIGAAISSALGTGTGLAQTFISQMDLPPEARQEMMTALAARTAGGGAGIFGALCMTLFVVPIAFLLGSGIYFVIAKMFGGTGDFSEQTYLLSTFSVPIIIVNAIIGVVPYLGGCVTFFISIYQLVLAYFAIKVSHNLSSGKAIMTILIPILVVFACVICGFVVMFVTVLGAAGLSGNF